MAIGQLQRHQGATEDLNRRIDIHTAADPGRTGRGVNPAIGIDEHGAGGGDRDTPARTRVGIGQNLTVLDHDELGIDADIAAVGPGLALDRAGDGAVHEVDEIRRGKFDIAPGGLCRGSADRAALQGEIRGRQERDIPGQSILQGLGTNQCPLMQIDVPCRDRDIPPAVLESEEVNSCSEVITLSVSEMVEAAEPPPATP